MSKLPQRPLASTPGDKSKGFLNDSRKIHQLKQIQWKWKSTKKPIATFDIVPSVPMKRSGLNAEKVLAKTTSYFPQIQGLPILRDLSKLALPQSESSNDVMDFAMEHAIEHSPRQKCGRQQRKQRVVKNVLDCGSQCTGGNQLSDKSDAREKISLETVLSWLDMDGLRSLQQAFEEYGMMDEEQFVAEFLGALPKEKIQQSDRVILVSRLQCLFHQAEINTKGTLSWDRFSDFLAQSQASDVQSTPKFVPDSAPPVCKLTTELLNMKYFHEPDKMVIFSEKARGFQVMNPASCKLESHTSLHSSHFVLDVAYSSNHRAFVTASTSPVLTFYDVEQLEIEQQIPTESPQRTLAAHNDTCFPILYSSSSTGQVHTWNTETLTCLNTFFSKGSAVTTKMLVLDPITQLANASMDGNIYMIDLNSNRLTKTLRGRGKVVTQLAYCQSSGYLVSGGLDQRVEVWNPRLEQNVGFLAGHDAPIIGIETLSSSDDVVVTADEKGTVKIWDLRKFAAVQTVRREHYERINGNRAVTGGRSMRSMTYMTSTERLAIGHSSVYFLDKHEIGTNGMSGRHQQTRGSTIHMETEEIPSVLHLFYNRKQHLFVVITPWKLKCWDAGTGVLTNSTIVSINGPLTCAAERETGFECCVGTANGSLGRVAIPTGSILSSQPNVHEANEVTAIQALKKGDRLVSSDDAGCILITNALDFSVILRLNQTRTTAPSSIKSPNKPHIDSKDAEGVSLYEVPQHLERYFGNPEVARLRTIFQSADRDHCGAVGMHKLPKLLREMLSKKPSIANSASTLVPTNKKDSLGACIDFVTLLNILKDCMQESDKTYPLAARSTATNRLPVSCLAAQCDRQMMITTSSETNMVHVWNLRNGALLARNRLTSLSNRFRNDEESGVKSLTYLDPFPYFVCVGDGSSCVSIWSSTAVPPLTKYPYEIVFEFPHSSRKRAVGGWKDAREVDEKAKKVFLTEHDQTKDKGMAVQCIITSVAWICGEANDKKLLCLGDNQSGIAVYDMHKLVDRLEKLRTGAMNDSESIAPLDFLPPQLITRVSYWRVHSSFRVRELQVVRFDQEHELESTLLAAVLEFGSVSLWTVAGERAGEFNSRTEKYDYQPHTWQIDTVATSHAEMRHRASAENLLGRIEARLHGPQRNRHLKKD